MNIPRTALVLGATGGIGSEVARRLHSAGWTIRALHRQATTQAASARNFHWLQGDAMQPADVVRAAAGASLIVHAVNPPGYRNWGQLVLPMLDSSIAAARQSGARILLPGTVYNYGPDAFPLLNEDSPQHPLTRKGAIRVEMERRLAAAADSGVRSLIVRAGDFFGSQAANNWFSQGLVQPGRAVTVVHNPGRAGIGHQWAYLPDVAETMYRLAEKEAELDAFASFQMQGHWDADGMQMAEAIRRVASSHAGAQAVRIKPLSWWLLRAMSPFVPTLREMQEMRYLWQQPIRMGNEKLLRTLGHEPHTPLDQAVRTTLQGLGGLPSPAGLALA